jgi:DNA primase
MPETLARDQFASDAAQKLGIADSLIRAELRQAALKRRDRVEARPATLTEVERVLLRALANTDMEGAYARHRAAEAVQKEPAWFEHLASFPAMQALALREAKDPMEVVEDSGQKALLAEALLGETRSPEGNEVEGAIQELQERAIEGLQRDLRAQIAEAERRGDYAGLALLTQKKLELDRALRGLHSHKSPQR